jgi:parallel beta-helix repeat protein
MNGRRFGLFRVPASSALVLALLVGLNLVVAASGSLFVSVAGAGTACSQSQPCSLQTAVGMAVDGDIIYLASGTYTGTGANVIMIADDITLYGGWDGAPTGPVVRDPLTHLTILDGQGGRRVVFINAGRSPTLDGLHLTRGNVADNGGGLFAAFAHPTVSNSHIYSNTAGFSGGGIYLNNSSDATLTGNTVYDNVASSLSGGGIYMRNSPDSTLVGITVHDNVAGGGGGLFLENCDSCFLAASHIFTNTSSTFGGGVFLAGSDGLTVSRSLIQDNRAEQGGGLYINNSKNVNLQDNSIEENTSTISGGGVFVFAQSDGTTLQENVVADNRAGGDGAGIQVQDSASAVLINNIIVENQLTGAGSNGAGIYLNAADAQAWHTTLSGNRGGNGQGIHLQSGATLWMTNTILVTHTLGIEVGAGTTAWLEGTLWGANAWSNNTDWGGAGTIHTGTVSYWETPGFSDPSSGNYHILASSAARDAGVNTAVMIDIDHQPRPTGLGYDIGADEYHEIKGRVYLPLLHRSSQ